MKDILIIFYLAKNHISFYHSAAFVERDIALFEPPFLMGVQVVPKRARMGGCGLNCKKLDQKKCQKNEKWTSMIQLINVTFWNVCVRYKNVKQSNVILNIWFVLGVQSDEGIEKYVPYATHTLPPIKTQRMLKNL